MNSVTQPLNSGIPAKMKAVTYYRYGSPEVFRIEDRNTPIPKEKEVLVRVYASTVTAADTKMREGKPRIGRLYTGIGKPKRSVPGVEFAGVIEHVGKNVVRFGVGDEVLGETLAMGCHADYVVISEDDMLALKPSNTSMEEASALCSGAVTALNFLRKSGLEKGQRILIYGASGSVGSYAVQLAKISGAHVTAVCGTANVEWVKNLGADKVIDYKTEDFTTSGMYYDIVLDAVGKSSFEQCKSILTDKGIYLSVDLSGELLCRMIRSSVFGGKKATTTATGMLPAKVRLQLLLEILSHVANGRLKTIIDRTYSLEEIADAHRYVDSGRKKGNVVISL
jgi:NADPH:quinone reductase-like Zn-dependent oxidoreductase